MNVDGLQNIIRRIVHSLSNTRLTHKEETQLKEHPNASRYLV